MDLLKQLRQEKEALMLKIDAVSVAIRSLESAYGNDSKQGALIPNTPISKIDHNTHSKDSQGWKEYLLEVIEKINGAFTTTDVITYLIKNNPSMEQKTIKNAARQYLHQLNNDGKIIADQNYSGKGYRYSINK